MKHTKINTHNANYYWDLVSRNDDSPTDNVSIAESGDEDDKWWWADKMPEKSYSIEELRARIAESERQFAMGNYVTSEELFKILDDKFHYRRTMDVEHNDLQLEVVV